MSKAEYYINAKSDGLALSVLEVTPEGHPKGILQLVHGMCEYKERYLPFMEYMAEKGFAVVIHDHRGHGKSVKNRADLGYMYEAGADALVDDILSVNQKIKEKYPGIPVILFGHSMGSLAVRAFTAKYDQCIDLLIISGSPSDNSGKAIAKMIAGVEGKIFGTRHKSRILTAMSTGTYNKKFADNGWLSTDQEIVDAYNASEYCGFMFTDDAFKVLFDLMTQAYDVKHWKCTHKDLPVLFVSGADDPCMVSVRKFSQAVHAVRAAGYTNVRGRIYKGMRHEILNEKDHLKVYRDILFYITRNLNLD